MFHVPELARVLDHPHLGSDSSYGNNGAFDVESPEPGWRLALICSDEDGWEHVSVHAWNHTGKQRTPTWKEMAFVKALCWDDEDTAVEFHPPRSQYVNVHPNVLHLWRPVGSDYTLPPLYMV